jgi:hypothetical protein
VTADEVAKVHQILEAVLSDPQLTAWGAEVLAVDPTSDDSPTILREFYARHIDTVSSNCVPAATDLVKFVPVDRFLLFYADADVRAEYYGLARGSYEADVGGSSDPSGRLTADLPPDPDAVLVTPEHSWVIPQAAVSGLTAASVIDQLRLSGTPPLAALDFPLGHLTSGGVTVRSPCAIDIIPTMDATWRPGAVPNELIDNTIRRHVCPSVRWVA